jgi:Uma2 family endonuclease
VSQVQRVRMSWEEFLLLPDQTRAEWVDGEAVILMAPNSFTHGDTVAALIALLRPLFPQHHVVTEVGLWLPRNRLRAPDVMVVDHPPEDTFVSDAPLLCIEVLSPSTRSEDTIRKSMEYAEGGAGHYWVVDPELGMIELLANVDGAWDVVGHLDAEQPTADVDLAGVTVALDLRELLRN